MPTTPPAEPQSQPNTLDVRQLRKPDKHPAIFDRYQKLSVGESFVLVNDHDPVHLREEFESEHPGGYEWEYLDREPRAWQIRITKRARTLLPRVLVNTGDLPESAPTGAVWSIAVRQRDLDSNVISIPPGDAIDPHTGPGLDVLIHVLRGDGTLTTELGQLPLSAGDVLFLPRLSIRGFTAGAGGLQYLTVHRKRDALVLESRPD